MRFVEDGPNIPYELIEQRDLGNVIFFCGAGVSIPVGLPSFLGLTEKIVNDLGAVKARESILAGESLDRVFGVLVREFGRSEIDRRIQKLLRTPVKANLSHHRAILDLSISQSGRRQVVTTNFDLLFERAMPDLPKSVPPLLPDLNLGQQVDGIIYLHGRLGSSKSGTYSNYVISSTDFGRAYLTEGWAARFVKSLRENYTIVLLGYRADDPPMRYLLEGLNSEGAISYQYPLYAFTQGNEGDAEEEWFDRGVSPISYSGPAHDGLWGSLEAWARAVRKPDEWAERIMELMRKSPRDLAAFERGQVAQFLGTKAGAKLARQSAASTNAEWVCVLDPNTRQLASFSSWRGDVATEPAQLYGLDDDPASTERGGAEPPTSSGRNFLGPLSSDAAASEQASLVGWNPLRSNHVGERLEHLAAWFASVADQPAAIWWAAGWKSLSPTMNFHLARRLVDQQRPMPAEAQKFWHWYLNDGAPPEALVHDGRWFELRELVSRHGWSDGALRILDRILSPYLQFARNNAHGVIPKQLDWQGLEIRDVVDLSVRTLDRHNVDIKIGDPFIKPAVAAFRRNLGLTSSLLDEIGTRWWRTPPLIPDPARESSYESRKAAMLLVFRDLFDRLANLDPSSARYEMSIWPQQDKYFFAKMFLYALSAHNFLEGDEFVNALVGLPDDVFWGAPYQRELLWALRNRWASLVAKQRKHLEEKILFGPARWDNESDEDFERRKASHIAINLTWLQSHGCILSRGTSDKLANIKKAIDGWKDEWALEADETFGSRGGIVERVTELRGLDQLPIAEIVTAAEAKTEDRLSELRDYRPFAGLVQEFPARALAGLRFALKQGDFPQRFWETLLSDWPEDTPRRLKWTLFNTLARLERQKALALRYYAPRWVRENFKDLAKGRRAAALKVFDQILDPYKSSEPEFLESGIGDTTVGGVVQTRSQASVDKSINSPIGHLTEAIWKLMPERRTSPSNMPSTLASRFRSLFSLPGDGGRHAACIVAMHTRWLANWYPGWFERELLPAFQVTHPLSEGVWHGWAAGDPWLRADRLTDIKWALADVLCGKAPWRLDENANQTLIQWFVYFCRKQEKRAPLFNYVEARAILMSLNDGGRGDALWALGNVLEQVGEWRNFVRPFIENAWPRHVRFRTENNARSFARLLEHAGKHFPEATKIILPFLRPVAHLDMLTYRMTRNADQTPSLAERYPGECLRILDAMTPDDRSRRPYELPEVLEIIGETKPDLRRTPEFRRLQELAG